MVANPPDEEWERAFGWTKEQMAEGVNHLTIVTLRDITAKAIEEMIRADFPHLTIAGVPTPKRLTKAEVRKQEAAERKRARRKARHDRLFPDCEGGFDHDPWCDY